MPSNQPAEYARNRHTVNRQDWLTSWILYETGSWGIWATSMSKSQTMTIVEKMEGISPHSIIASGMFALQNRLDHLFGNAHGMKISGTKLQIRLLSLINHVGGTPMLNCSGTDAFANAFMHAVHEACDRVGLNSSMQTEIMRLQSQISRLGCGRIYRAA